MGVCICTCLYVCVCVMYTRVYANRVLLLFYISRLDSHPRLFPSTLNFASLYSICKNIQVRYYIVVSTVKKFYTFSLEYGMQSDRSQSDLRRSKANPNPRTQVKRHRNSTSSIGHAACEESTQQRLTQLRTPFFFAKHDKK